MVGLFALFFWSAKRLTAEDAPLEQIPFFIRSHYRMAVKFQNYCLAQKMPGIFNRLNAHSIFHH
jgi:hypothetical protein